jgi:UDP:flavonoid glycosyltransferase YjiC (YdhE family)
MALETGHYTGTFRLARTLHARGHKIVYLGIADFEQLVKSQGFEFIPFAVDLLPVGYGARFAASQAQPLRGVLPRWRKRLTAEQLFGEYLRRIEDGELDLRLTVCEPDLLLCDTLMWYVAIRAYRLGIPTVDISIPLSLYCNTRIPPVVSSIRPKPTVWSAVQVWTTWKWLRLKFFFTKRVAALLFGTYRFPTRMHHLVDVFKQIAKRSGYPCKENETWWYSELGPRLVLPEIMLGPQAFQLPESPADGRRYLGDFVDINRREEPLEAGVLDEHKLLVFCSLGTAAAFYPHAMRFFRAVVDASTLREEWQFVLHVGNHPEATKLGSPRPNLLIRERVPQLTLLRSARVMVTHGGMNSIMECIHFEVPMVIVPGLRDQPGNATRAVHHGLAVTARMASITAKELVSLIVHVMEDCSIREALARMKRAIADEKGMDASIQFIETFPMNRTD